MRIELAKAVTLPFEDLVKGDLVIPATVHAVESPLCLVVDGGRWVAGMRLIPLSGRRALNVINARGGDGGYIRVAVEGVWLDVSEPLRGTGPQYQAGNLAIDQEAAYMLVKFNDGSGDEVLLLNMASWTIEGAPRLNGPSHWPASWKLQAKQSGCDTPIVLLESNVIEN